MNEQNEGFDILRGIILPVLMIIVIVGGSGFGLWVIATFLSWVLAQ